MEIRYTLEILTKDIQDIGKLVENLHNSPDGSTLELDLALSKLRNVYDVLSDIRTDISNQKKPLTPTREAVTHVPKETGPVAEIPGPEPLVESKVETPDPEPLVEASTKNIPGTLAEKFSAESSINENMAGTRDQEIESKLLGPAIDNIGKNIGINDRFLIIRELFDGDSDGFGKLIRDLDNATGMQEAIERLNMQFRDTPNHEGVAILGMLVKRRFSKT